MNTPLCALFARVSSERQAQARTIESQLAELEKRIADDGGKLSDSNKFVDDGYSGAVLVRPALEKLRDQIALNEIDKLYVHSPDRLSRKYAHQMILLEEFKAQGVEVVFLNCETNDNPESQLLVQMQGMIAEYERAKIMERHRRGKIHSAKRGSVNVLSTAPYSYQYIDKNTGAGQASLKINVEQAIVVKKIFSWIGRDRLSMGEVCRRLENEGIPTQTGKKHWDRSVIWAMLKNPAYKGEAAFGKTKVGKLKPQLRPQKHSSEQPKRGYSVYQVDKKDWITIEVPAIIDDSLFSVVQAQLAENRKMARTQRRGASYLLQGLVVCARCQHAFYGKPVKNKRGEKIDRYAYYRCIGTDAYRFGGQRICDNTQLRTDTVEMAVWEEVKQLLKEPTQIIDEYQRRLSSLQQSPLSKEKTELEKQRTKIQKGVNRLIDSYAEGYLSKAEFEPRIKAMKARLKGVEEQCQSIIDQQALMKELQLIVTNIESFAEQVRSNLNGTDWEAKRSIIRALIKRVEIDKKEVNVVFRVNPPASSENGPMGERSESLQHCCRSKWTTLRRTQGTRASHTIFLDLLQLA